MAAKLNEVKNGEGNHLRPGDPLLPWGGRRIPHAPSTRDAASFPKVLMGRPSLRARAPEVGLRTPAGTSGMAVAPSLPPLQGWRYRHGSKAVTCAHLEERRAGGITLGGSGALPGPARNNISGQKEAKGNGDGARRAGEARRTRAQAQGSEDRTNEAPTECCHIAHVA